MENENSEKTGRLTPGQIDAVVRLSGEISVIRKLIRSLSEREGHAYISINNAEITFFSKQSSDVLFDDERHDIFIDDSIFKIFSNYFAIMNRRLVSELEEVISGEGGER